MEPELRFFILIAVLFVGSAVVSRWLRPKVVGLSLLATGLILCLVLRNEQFASSRAGNEVFFLIMLPLIFAGFVLACGDRATHGPTTTLPKPKCEPELPAAPTAGLRRGQVVGLILWATAMAIVLGKLGFGVYRNRDLFWRSN